MPLTKRQKRRLLEVSKMIESSIVVKDDMEEIQLEYAQEIDDIINLIKKKDQPKQGQDVSQSSLPVNTKARQNIQLARMKRKQIQRERGRLRIIFRPRSPK